MSNSPLENLIFRLWAKIKCCKVSVISGIAAGVMAHMFVMTNKLINADETSSLFTKGATVESGRWFLEVTKYLFPNYSMPWIYGLLSILFITAAGCLIVVTFDVRSPLLKCLIPAVFTSFPAIMAYMCYMFTAAPFCLAAFLASFSVYLCRELKIRKTMVGILLLTLSCGTYQSFVCLAASMYVILLLKKLLADGEDAKAVFRKALKYFAVLMASLLLYIVTTLLVNKIGGYSIVNDYAISETPLLTRFRAVYTAYAGIFIKGYFGYIRSPFSAVLHGILLAILAYRVMRILIARKDAKTTILSLVLFAIYPLATNTLYLVSNPGVIQTLSEISFITFYVLVAVFVDGDNLIKDIASVILTLVVIMNVYAANESYLKMHIDYENAYSFYTAVIADVYSMDDYEAGMPVMFYGYPSEGLFYKEFDIGQMLGPHEYISHVYTRDYFIKYYLGSDINLTCKSISIDDDMPVYPSAGSIMVIDGVMVVRFE